MRTILDNFFQEILLIVLLCASGFVSGSETAFFQLSRRQIQIFRRSEHRMQRLVAQLLERPKRLLTSLLFSNMMVNVLYCAIASLLTVRFGRALGPTSAVVCGVVTFLALLFFGEILPKAMAYSHSTALAPAAAPACFVSMRVLSRLIAVIDILIIEPTIRLLGLSSGPDASRRAYLNTASEFKTFIDSFQRDDSEAGAESPLLSRILELQILRVRHVMQPRVDMVSCDGNEDPRAVQQRLIEAGLTRIPVWQEHVDNIVGFIHVRKLLLAPEKTVLDLLDPPVFVPEQKTVESLLEFFRNEGHDTAVVVDEYGGIAGVVSIEDIAHEMLLPIKSTTDIAPIEQLGPLEYRLSGDLPLHEWGPALGLKNEDMRIATIGGLVTSFLGRVPRPGDEVVRQNIHFTIETVEKNRIQSLLLSFDPISTARTQETPE